jgi:hypothetical protein
MSDATVQIVREFFEFNGFHVMTHWRHDAVRFRGAEQGIQFYVENTAPSIERSLDLVLRPGDIAAIGRALVEVRPWHTERLYASTIEASPVLLEVAGESAKARARQVFGVDDAKSILVISELPQSPEPRLRSIEAFREGGVDHVLEFPTILQEIIGKINASVSYAPSQTLQTIRLLKRYEFIRRQQLEFPFSMDPPIYPSQTQIECENESQMSENPSFAPPSEPAS